ncbi:MAG: hypothetical protein C0467_16470 [Planctomycetaceae bacterium]|nr:hypothetical protein [Planctomycetaceae bacterium]
MGSPILSEEDRAQLSARADEFHAALVRSGIADWEQFLSGLPANTRLAVLTELVIIDLSYRWGRGERPKIEEYIARFPEFGPAERIPTAVILEEHRARIKSGEHPDPESFRMRFPVQYPGISSEIESGRGATISGTIVSTIASADGGAALAQSHSPGGSESEYDFVKILGRGVFGEVWLAQKRSSGIDKAVKILMQAADHEAAHRERRALELIKNLRHPYLLSTDDFWVKDNRLHVAMELADGTLRDQLRRYREAGQAGVPAAELLGYMWEAAEGLDFLHSRHVIHRDIKPDNILLLHGHAKVGDFGLARYQEEVLAPMRTFAGTPAYMAPEVWGREGGPASDQYSLAIAYAELRQGTPPLKPRPIQQMLLAHSEGAFEFADFISPEERAVILKALAQKSEDRHPSCRAFVEALYSVHGFAGVPRSAGASTAGISGDSNFSQVPTQPDSMMAPNNLGLTKATVTTESFQTQVIKPRPFWQITAVSGGVLAFAILGGFGLWSALGDRGKHTGGGSQNADPGVKPPLVPEVVGLWVPPGTVAAPAAKEVTLASGRHVPEWVESKLGGETARFRLITGGGNGPPISPFYILESKVWNELYRAGGSDPTPASSANGLHAPVTHVTADEARAFAVKLGGQLPSPEQWDYAAGLYANVGRDEVTRPGGRPRVGLKDAKPLPTHGPDSGSDVNQFDLRDMAGNGREWTSGVLPTMPGERERGITRGNNFTFSKGLTFSELKKQNEEPHTQYRDFKSPYTSFRVVLPGP